jgi:tripartite-type tricarboxylate transporter receptor subunit TctC
MNAIPRRSFLQIAALGGASNAFAREDPAAFPSRPVTMVVPFAAGGPGDAVARVLLDAMSAALGQRVIVENITGAAGNIGTGRVARAAADGYTLIAGGWGTHVTNAVLYDLPYDVVKDFEPIGYWARNPQLIVARAGIPARTLDELIAWARKQPSVTAATAGVGSPAHLGALLFANRIGAAFEYVPYRGGAPALQDLIAGHVDLMLAQPSNSLQHVQSGRLKAYAVTAKSRLAAAPDIPTVDEAGLSGLYISVWFGLWAPKDTPQPIVAKLNAALVHALADATVRRRLADLGQEIPPREQQTPQALAALQKAEIDKWWPLIRAANMKAPAES